MSLSPSALERLAEHHARFLDSLAKPLPSRAEAEDLLQDAFVRGLERGNTLRDEESVVAWFYRLLRNAVADHYRREGAERRALEREPHDLAVEQGVDAALEQAACACVVVAVETLKPEYAELLRRVDVEGETVGDVARARGLSAGNARARLHRARQALRRAVEQTGHTCAAHGCVDCTCRASGGV